MTRTRWDLGIVVLKVLLWTALLLGVGTVWWGAAVTTKDVGLSVPDWPLCFGRINPEGWMGIPALFLEHGHRWIATFLGFATLAAFAVQWRLQGRPGWFVLLLVAVFVLLVYTLSQGSQNGGYYVAAALLALLCFLWLGLEWMRHQPMCMKIGSTALILVVTQASLGGLRVTEMSDLFGILHGILGQLFFCTILVWLLLVNHSQGASISMQQGKLDRVRRQGVTFLVLVVVQLVLAVSLRHSARLYLVASDFFTTGGDWIPQAASGAMWLMFLHKYWAWLLMGTGIWLFVVSRKWQQGSFLKVLPVCILVFLVAQFVLGIFILQTGKGFWPTNFHVLNGLCILALSVILVTKAFLCVPVRAIVAGPTAISS
jgi:heme A synthase